MLRRFQTGKYFVLRGMALAASLGIVLTMTGCTERYKEFRRQGTPTFRPPFETYARLVLLRETRKMQISQHEYQWLGYRYNLGVCHAGTIEDLPEQDWREVITSACSELRRIQKAYPHPCGNDSENTCPVSTQASLELASVKAALTAAAGIFSVVESPDGTIPATE